MLWAGHRLNRGALRAHGFGARARICAAAASVGTDRRDPWDPPRGRNDAQAAHVRLESLATAAPKWEGRGGEGAVSGPALAAFWRARSPSGRGLRRILQLYETSA